MNRTLSFLIAAAFILISSTLRAEGQTVLVVKLSNDTEVEYATADELKITYDGDDAVFSTTDVQAVHPRSSIVKMDFKDVPSSVNITEVEKKTQFLLYKDYILIKSTSALDVPRVFDISGRVLSTEIIRHDKNTGQVMTGMLPKGIFILHVNGESFKFIKN